MFRRASLVLLAFATLLGGCVGGEERKPRKQVSSPPTYRSPPSFGGSAFSGIEAPETRQCMATMGAAGFQFTPLPDRSFGGGCLAFGSVQLNNVGVPVTNLGAMRCPLAQTFAAWARHGVLPAARVHLRTEVIRIESFGTYNCRNINGSGSGRLSQHAFANAVDVAAFVLADGRRITVRGGWNGPDETVRRFLRVIHQSGCKRFRTTLGPDYNNAHADHFHFDMGGNGSYCR